MKLRTHILLLLLGVMGSLSAHTAHWITADHALRNTPNTWIEFRKTLTLSESPQEALAHIAADTKYWLWVGDSLIIFEGGLKRGPNPRDTYYDVVDLAPFLTAGDNEIRVLLWHFGKPGFSHVNSGQAGFLLDAPAIGLHTDRTWLSQRLDRYQTAGDPQPNWRLAESNIRYDARLEQQADWSASLEIGRWGSAPWNTLVERPIPQWKDYGIRQLETVAIPGITKAQLPYNAQFTPVIDITDPVGGTLIAIETDHVRGGGDNCIRAEYITRPGRQQYESLGWMNGEVLYLRYPQDAAIEVHGVSYRETGYDADFMGRFECSDEFLNRFREKAMRTLYVNMRDTYFDCPDRERAQWWGDVTILMNESFYQLDPAANLLTRKAMRELVDWQRADSTLFSPIPAQNYADELPAQMLAAISTYGFWSYYLHTGDVETMHYVYPAMKRYLGIWQLDATGLTVERTGGWSWGDWGSNIDIRLILAGWHYLALQSAINVAQLTGHDADVAHYEHTMQQIKAAYNLCWNGKAYRHPTYTGDTDDRVQALAVISGIASADKYRAIYKLFTTQWHASPYMETYVMEALMQMGYGSYALKRFKTRFAGMVNSTTHSTLFEGWEEGGYGGGSTNHAWSGGMLTILAQYLCGIKPTSAAWDTYTVAPNPLIASCSIDVPTVKGMAGFAYSDDDEQLACTLSVPHATLCTFVVPQGKYTRILIDGTPVSTQTSYDLSPGEHTVVCKKKESADVQVLSATHTTYTVTQGADGVLQIEADGRPITDYCVYSMGGIRQKLPSRLATGVYFVEIAGECMRVAIR